MKIIATLKHRGSKLGVFDKMFADEKEMRAYCVRYNYAILAAKKITLGR